MGRLERFRPARLCGLPVGREGVDNRPAATQGVAGTSRSVLDPAGAREFIGRREQVCGRNRFAIRTDTDLHERKNGNDGIH